MTDATEALLVRIDHFHDRKLYVTTVKAWLEELGVAHGRLVTMGDVHLLFIEAAPAQNDALLTYFTTKTVDTNAKDEPCIDRFIDVVGRKPIATATCKGFLEMNVLNKTLLERLMVSEWNCEKTWLEDALSTPRTKALIKWKEEAKNARKGRRKQAAQTRTAEREAKKAREEAEKAQKELEEKEDQADGDDDDANDVDGEEEVDVETKEEAEETEKEKPRPVEKPASVQQKPQSTPDQNQNKRKTPPNGHQNHSNAQANKGGSIAKTPYKQQPSGKQQHHAKKHKST